MTKKVVTRTFTRDFMEENDYPWELSSKTFLDDSRWALHYEGVFEFEGKHYMVQYQEGATEYQEGEDPWYHEDEIEATEVVWLPVVEHKWVPKSV